MQNHRNDFDPWSLFSSRSHTHPKRSSGLRNSHDRNVVEHIVDNRDHETLVRFDNAVYVHVPYCSHICKFCSLPTELGRPAEVSSAALEIVNQISEFRNKVGFRPEIQAVYFGGGSPSFLSPESLRLIVDEINLTFKPKVNSEISFEIRVNDASYSYLESIKNAGVNRLSFGIQSFDTVWRRSLGRIHDRDSTKAAILRAKQVGFEAVCLDLLYMLPGQTIEDWRRELEDLIDAHVDGLSVYRLNIHKHTKLYKQLSSAHAKYQQAQHLEYMMYQECMRAIEPHFHSDTPPTVVNYAFSKAEKAKYLRIQYAPKGNVIGFGRGASGIVGDTIYEYPFKREPSAKKGVGVVWNTMPEYRKAWEVQSLPILGSLEIKTEHHRLFPCLDDELEKLEALGLVVVNERTANLTPLGRYWSRNIFFALQDKLVSSNVTH